MKKPARKKGYGVRESRGCECGCCSGPVRRLRFLRLLIGIHPAQPRVGSVRRFGERARLPRSLHKNGKVRPQRAPFSDLTTGLWVDIGETLPHAKACLQENVRNRIPLPSKYTCSTTQCPENKRDGGCYCKARTNIGRVDTIVSQVSPADRNNPILRGERRKDGCFVPALRKVSSVFRTQK